MEFLKRLDLSGKQFLKLIGLLVIFLIALAALSSFFFGIFGSSTGLSGTSLQFAPAPNMVGESAMMDSDMGISMRSTTESYPTPINGGYTPGDDSEEYEVKEYRASVETRNLEQDCGTVRELKSRTDIIFENASEDERTCSYIFKVEKNSVEAVLAVISDLNPKDINETSYTIKREVTDYMSEIQILENKLASLDKTLADAIASYDSISVTATNVGNVETLARIIDSKLNMIERLTNARIDASNQLDRINRAKNEALDRLAYTYFYINIYENKFVDGEELKDSWKNEVKLFVRNANSLVQDISIGLIAFLLNIAKFAIYFIILLLIARFGWLFALRVWKSGEKDTQKLGE